MTDSPGIWDLARQYMLAECALSFIAIAWNQLDATDLAQEVVRESKKLQNKLNVEKENDGSK